MLLNTDQKLTHVNDEGEVRMVDVSSKGHTYRQATAHGCIYMQQHTYDAIMQGDVAKGDVLATARIAGIMAAKKTSELIPMCHPINMTHAHIEIEPLHNIQHNPAYGFMIRCICSTYSQTGIEMEALTGTSVACLTMYDMCKALDRAMTIEEIYLEEKQGGKSKHWVRPA